MTTTPLMEALTMLDRAKDLLADVICDDRGMTVECHNFSEAIEEFLVQNEINT